VSITIASQAAMVMTIKSPVATALSVATANVCAVAQTIRPVLRGKSVWRILACKAAEKMGNVPTVSAALTINAFTAALTTLTVLPDSAVSITNVVSPALRTPVAAPDAFAKLAYASMAAAKIPVVGIMLVATTVSVSPGVATTTVATKARPVSKTVALQVVSPMARVVPRVMFAIAKRAHACSV
jgi:hypothetical protein